MKFKRAFFLLLFIVFNKSLLFAQTASLKIINSINKTTTFSYEDIKAMPYTTLNIEAEDGTPHNYSGVEIQQLLGRANVSFGKEVRRQTLDSYMFIKAADGYSVVYALTEIDSAFSNKKMILALTKDGNVLPQNAGPFQIITTGEKKHARLIRQVTEINIHKAE